LGLKLATQGAATGLILKSFPPVAELLKTFSENGGRMSVCPPCAKSYGVTRQPD
jgi:predicted peroxiredoxin